jgi:SurA N-terminal domain
MRIELHIPRNSYTAVGLVTLFALIGHAAVIDRVALVVGKTVFTQSEVDDEARLSELEAGKPLDLSAAQRRQAAERLVDQELLREEMSATQFQAPDSDAEALLRSFRQRHFPSLAQYHAALTRYGVTEDALKQRLIWEVSLIRFTDQRFKTFAEPLEGQTANRADGAAQTAPDTVDQLMDTWLKQQRGDTRIVFKQEAFQ